MSLLDLTAAAGMRAVLIRHCSCSFLHQQTRRDLSARVAIGPLTTSVNVETLGSQQSRQSRVCLSDVISSASIPSSVLVRADRPSSKRSDGRTPEE